MWELTYTEKAAAMLRQFLTALPGLADCVQANLLRLAAKPTLGRTAGFPYPPTGMVFQFDCYDGTEKHHFSIHYRYGQSEQSLVIFNVGHVHLA